MQMVQTSRVPLVMLGLQAFGLLKFPLKMMQFRQHSPQGARSVLLATICKRKLPMQMVQTSRVPLVMLGLQAFGLL
jgi:hypothetical protein